MTKRLKIAVVGAGAAGLCSARQFSEKGYQISVLEKKNQLGGAWIYPSKHTSIYKNLKTIIPKEIMCFPNYPFPAELPSFVSHSDVLKYLQSYAENFDINKHIQFQCLVELINPIHSTQYGRNSAIGFTKWQVCTEDLVSRKKASEEFDAVLLCNGHFSEPFMPSIPGLEYFKGSVMHSKFYRDPVDYAGQDVLVIGAGYSGTDIALDLSTECNKVYISNRGAHLTCPLPDNMVEVPCIFKINEEGKVIFSDRKELQVHSILMATGYHYSFPFLSPEVGIKVTDYNRVTPLYKHTFNPLYPAMAFVGLPFDLVPFPFIDYQVRWIESVWSNNCSLPDRAVMIRNEEETYKARLEQGLKPRLASHWLGNNHWEYVEFFRESFKGEVLPLMYEEIDEYVARQRDLNLMGFKKMSYCVFKGNKWKVGEER